MNPEPGSGAPAEPGAPAESSTAPDPVGQVPVGDVSLDAVLRRAGAPERDIAEAAAHGHLQLLLIEQLVLPETGAADLDGVAEATGLSTALVAQLWRSLGFVEPRPGERIFHDGDIELLTTIGHLLDLGIVDDDLVVQMARVIGSSQARIASALVDALITDAEIEGDQSLDNAEHPAGPAAPDRDRAARAANFARMAPLIVPTVLDVMGFVWRRHVQGEARARITREVTSADPDHRAVGFADLVGFTALSQQVTSRELANMVDRFEAIAYDTVTRLGGRVVKMIGDEVMFTIEDERVAAEIALTLSDTYRDDLHLSDVRVGLAAGPVLQREADLYGPVVNLASRIVSIAHPGSVLCDQEVHDVLADEPDFIWKPIGTRSLKNIGKVPLHVLRRATGPQEEPDHRAAAEAERAERREARLAEIALRRQERRRDR